MFQSFWRRIDGKTFILNYAARIIFILTDVVGGAFQSNTRFEFCSAFFFTSEICNFEYNDLIVNITFLEQRI